MRKFFIPSNCSDNVIHFDFNHVHFALIRRAPNNSTQYTTTEQYLHAVRQQVNVLKSKVENIVSN